MLKLKQKAKCNVSACSSDKHENFIKSMRNFQKLSFMLASNINGYDVMIAQEIVMTESALKN